MHHGKVGQKNNDITKIRLFFLIKDPKQKWFAVDPKRTKHCAVSASCKEVVIFQDSSSFFSRKLPDVYMIFLKFSKMSKKCVWLSKMTLHLKRSEAVKNRVKTDSCWSLTERQNFYLFICSFFYKCSTRVAQSWNEYKMCLHWKKTEVLKSITKPGRTSVCSRGEGCAKVISPQSGRFGELSQGRERVCKYCHAKKYRSTSSKEECRLKILKLLSLGSTQKPGYCIFLTFFFFFQVHIAYFYHFNINLKELLQAYLICPYLSVWLCVPGWSVVPQDWSWSWRRSSLLWDLLGTLYWSAAPSSLCLESWGSRWSLSHDSVAQACTTSIPQATLAMHLFFRLSPELFYLLLCKCQCSAVHMWP